MLEPKVLKQFHTELLQKAEECNIRELKIFGKNIDQAFIMQAGIDFIIIPESTMTIWHKRRFEISIASILDTTVGAYTSSDLDDLVKKNIITSEQARDYFNQAVSFEQYISQANADSVKESISSSTESSTSDTQRASLEKL